MSLQIKVVQGDESQETGNTSSETTPLLMPEEILLDPPKTISYTLRIISISFLAILILTLLSFYYVIIPHRIQKAVNAPDGIIIDLLTVYPPTNAGIDFDLIGHRMVTDESPINSTLESTQLDLVFLHSKSKTPVRKAVPIITSFLSFFGLDVQDWSNDDRFFKVIKYIASFDIPDIFTPSGLKKGTSLPIQFKSTFKNINIDSIYQLIDSIIRETQLWFRMQGLATVNLDGMARYIIPMWSYFPTTKDSNSNPMNIIINEKRIDIITDPQTQKQLYTIFLNITHSNPFPIIIQPLLKNINFSIYYEDSRILDVYIPESFLSLNKGNNTKWMILQSNLDHADELMDVIGKYSEGENVSVVFKKFKGECCGSHVEWIHDFFLNLCILFDVPFIE